MLIHRDTVSWTQELRRRDLVLTRLQGVWHQESSFIGAGKWLLTPALELQEPRWHLLLGYWLMSLAPLQTIVAHFIVLTCATVFDLARLG